MNKLKLIRFIVFVLTFLLIFGTLTILGLLYQKTHNKTPENSPLISLKQPLGSYIKEFRSDGEKLYILTVGGGQEDRIVIYDVQNNQILSTIKMN